MTAVSVILCTRNGRSKKFLDEALRSVLGQSVPPAEVILVDDGSSDGTAGWVAETFPLVRVLPNLGRGLAAARNTGIRAASHPWIAFIDDDDVWNPDKLACQLAQASNSDRPEMTIWVAMAAMIQGSRATRETDLSPPTYWARWPVCLLGCPVPASGALLAASLLKRVGPFDESIQCGSAYQYWIRSLLAGASIRYSDRVLILLRRHPAQMTALDKVPANMLDGDRMCAPFLEMLPPPVARRISCGSKLIRWRTLLWRSGPAAAARYWANTSLGSGSPGWRTVAFFLLDTAACRAPLNLSRRLREKASRLLAGASAETDSLSIPVG